MKNKIRLIGAILIVAIIAANCTGNDPKARIRSLEEQIRSEGFSFNQEGMKVAEDLANAYLEYAEKNESSAEAPEYLYKAAELSLNLNNAQQSLELYNRIIYQYPDFEKVPECLFLVAFIYENNLQNYGKARELYQLFIERYPDHEFADDAAISIENMGKSPEELIRQFEEKARMSDSLDL